jgi:hypothetical protein
MPSKQLLADMGKFNEELIKAGVHASTAQASNQPPSPPVSGSQGTKRTVIDGPFTESKELIAGYWLWQVKSLDEAIEWVKRCPCPHPGHDTDVEIRPLFEPSDFQ